MGKPRKRQDSGFTLIELMVTLAVLAILAVAAAPSFRDFIDRYRLRGAADTVVSFVADARSQAVRSGLDVNVTFAGSGMNWCVGANSATPPTGGNDAGAASACDCTNAAQCLVSGARTATQISEFPGVALKEAVSSFTFDSKLGTMVPLGTTTATLVSPSKKYSVDVKVNALGQARLCVPSGAPPIAGVASCT